MRDISSLRLPIVTDISAIAAFDGKGIDGRQFFDVELALHALSTAAPGQHVDGVPALLDGHGAFRSLLSLAPEDAPTRISNARIAIGRPFSPHRWRKLVAAYRAVPDRVRAFEIDDDGNVAIRSAIAVAPDRLAVFERILTEPLPFAGVRTEAARAGTFKIGSSQRRLTVDILEPPGSASIRMHPPGDLRPREPLLVSWSELIDTAVWMDEKDRGAKRSRAWEQRIRSSALLTRGHDEAFAVSEALSVDGLLHVAGVVSAGKTSLIQVIAVWAAKSDRRVTIVLGDNAAIFDLVNEFNYYLPNSAAPILGQRNRRRQLVSLHKRQPAEPGMLRPSQPVGFEWVSSACALSALLDSPEPLGTEDAPCEDLIRYDESKDQYGQRSWFEGPKQMCPFWYSCQRNQASIALIDAPIWVATHWGLTHTRVPAPVTERSIRYLEAAWRRSDLFLIDEVDRVQAGLDRTFAESCTLFGPGKEAWVDQVVASVDARLRETRRAERQNPDVREFTSNLDRARTLGNELFNLMQRDAQANGAILNAWMGPEYFTALTLSARLCRDLTGFDPKADDDSASFVARAYEALKSAFDAYIDAPQSRASDHENGLAASLAELNHHLLIDGDEARQTDRFESWVESLTEDPAYRGAIAVANVSQTAMRLQLVLVSALFSHYLNQILYGWPTVSRLLNMDAAPRQQSPRDLRSLIAEPPMGTILGFQYLAPANNTERAAGDLHFFEATGVGRSLLLDLPNLFPAEGRGPNAILLSGTSWAGNSPRYNVDVRVDAILKPHDDLIAGIEESTFEVSLQSPAPEARPIRVSGVSGADRLIRVRQLTECLLRSDADGYGAIQREIDTLPERRKKVLLLVGSYREAEVVFDALGRGSGLRARYLVSDAATDEPWIAAGSARLSRGDVASFGQDDSDVLIAPLLAIERGHNILNTDGVAAIGAAYFLVRPHPSPQDIAWVTQSMNQKSVQRDFQGEDPADIDPRLLARIGEVRRREDQLEWRRLLQTELVYSRLHNDPRIREQLIWTQIVTMWQVIGRLVRGGQAARVYFCDAAFAPGIARGHRDSEATSLLLGMRKALARYCDESSREPDRHLVRALYGPMYRALSSMKGA